MAGAALTVAGPLLADSLHAAPASDGTAIRRSRHWADGVFNPDVDLSAPPPAAAFAGMRWRHLGPFRGGRVAAVSGVPGRPNEFYYGAVNGGVWKSIDAGRVWTAVFDDQPIASIGALAVAPSKPDTIYVGSGESTLRDSTGYGNGVYKSIDAGWTWTHLGLTETHHIGRIAIDPRNPDIVFVAAIGKLYSASEERGVFRSDDAGATWRRLSNDPALWGRGWHFEKISVDPKNADIVYVPNVSVSRRADRLLPAQRFLSRHR